ncbi:hypothetical protein ACCT09_23785 [Rhizobium ruizarguesonis]|jgi:hypothetical protein
MAELGNAASPMMSGTAGLETDQARWQFREEFEKVCPFYFPIENP